jgi:Reverse transcriptase (RNA-dependent DNA polymerase)
VKDKSRNLTDVENYRTITLIRIISKVFEHVILSTCEKYLVTDKLQFGFKRSTGCTDAIFALRTIITHFNVRGSTVFMAALDIKKAFDTVNHNKMFSSLINIGFPRSVVAILNNGYGKLFVNFRWGCSYYTLFSVTSGVCQGSVFQQLCSIYSLICLLYIYAIKISAVTVYQCLLDAYYMLMIRRYYARR